MKFQGLQNSGTDFRSDGSAYWSSVFTFCTSLVNGVPDSMKRNYVCFFLMRTIHQYNYACTLATTPTMNMRSCTYIHMPCWTETAGSPAQGICLCSTAVLQYMESFELHVTGLKAVTDTGDAMTLELEERQAPVATTSVDIMVKALYLLYRFGVSHECYHELAQVHINRIKTKSLVDALRLHTTPPHQGTKAAP